MSRHRIDLKKSAVKDLEKLERNVRDSVMKSIEKLGDNPKPSGVKKLQGAQNLYRLRAGDYRIIYSLHDEIITLYYIRHRRDVYRTLH